MKTVGQEVGKIETRLRQLGGKLDKLVAQVEETGTEAQSEYRKWIDHAKDKHSAVQAKLDAYKAAKGERWDHFKAGIELAWHDLETAFKDVPHKPL